MLEEYFNSKKIPIWEANYINIIKFSFLIKELSCSSTLSDERPKRFISFIEEEVKRIYIFYSSIEREVYLTINKRISLKKHYFQLGVEEIYGEMKKLKQISIIIYNFIKYINLNIGLIQKMTQIYKSAFPNDEINEIYKYFYYEVNTLNSDINYIFQYKIVDEVTVILDEFINILLERTNNKNIPFKMLIEEENMLSDSIVVYHTNTDNLKRNDNQNEFQTVIDENGEKTTKNMKKFQKNLTISSALSKSTTYSEMKILEGTSNINNIIKEYKLKIYEISCEIRRNIEYIEVTSMEYREGVLSINNFSFFDNKLLVNDSNNNNKHNLSIIGVGYDDNILSNPNQGILKYNVFAYNDENRSYSQIKKNMHFIIIYNFIYNLKLYMPISQIFAFMYERSTNTSYSYSSLEISKAEDRIILINESEKSYSFDLLLFIFSIGIVYFLVPITNYISSTIKQRNIKSYIIFCNILFAISCLIIVFQANINDYIHLLNHSKFNVFCENSQFGIVFIISRVVLSMSSIKSLSKQYISKNSPNELLKSYIIKYNYSNYFGLLMSFLYNMILIFTIKKQVFLIAYSLILVIHFVYFLMFLLYFDKESIGSKDENVIIDEEYDSNQSNTSNLDKKKDNLLENENIPSSSNRKNSIRSSIQTNTIQLSFEENNMINKINIDLNKVNKIQNFTSTNYLGSEIEEIINNEMTTISKSRFISKSFFLLFINTLLFKSTFEGNLLLFSFLFVIEGEGILGLYHVSLIMFLSLLMIIPVYILIKNVSRREAFIFSIFFMTLIYFGLYYKSSVILYIILFPFIIGFSFFNELYVSKILNEVIPSRYVVCKLNSEQVIYNLSFILKGVYFVLIGVSLYVNHNVSYLKNQIFLFLSILYGIGMFLNIVMIRFLKGKAICRIINNRS